MERERVATSRLMDEEETLADLISSFQKAPLFNTAYEQGFGTLYTSVYYVGAGTAQYLWPGESLEFNISNFKQQDLIRDYGAKSN